MYKVLIVDDETWVRKGIRHKLLQLDLPFTWLKEAGDGSEALEAMAEDAPDVVITDIKMDEMDGIALVNEAQSRYPHVRFMIISGHAEFEYAEQALNMGVMGYLLKPIKDDQFRDVFMRLLQHVRDQRGLEQKLGKQERAELENRKLQMERLLNEQLQRPAKAAELAGEPVADDSAYYALCVIHIDNANYTQTSFRYHDLDLLKFAVLNIAADIPTVTDKRYGYNFRDKNQLLLLLAGGSEAEVKRDMDELSFRLYTSLTRALKITVTIGVSFIEAAVSEELYKQARRALELRFIKGHHRIYYAGEASERAVANVPEEQIRLLRSAIELHNFDNVEIILRELFSAKRRKSASPADYKLTYLEIVRLLVKIHSALETDTESDYDFDFLSVDPFVEFDRFEDIIQYILTTIVSMVKPKFRVWADCSALVRNIQTHIQQNYAENISVKQLSQTFAINPNYLSTLYRQETGSTLIKDLTNIRLNKACDLLASTSLAVADIASSVGYDDVQYFYRKFKQQLQLTPMEYRAQAGGGEQNK